MSDLIDAAAEQANAYRRGSTVSGSAASTTVALRRCAAMPAARPAPSPIRSREDGSENSQRAGAEQGTAQPVAAGSPRRSSRSATVRRTGGRARRRRLKGTPTARIFSDVLGEEVTCQAVSHEALREWIAEHREQFQRAAVANRPQAGHPSGARASDARFISVPDSAGGVGASHRPCANVTSLQF